MEDPLEDPLVWIFYGHMGGDSFMSYLITLVYIILSVPAGILLGATVGVVLGTIVNFIKGDD